jgi:hypothetical protein
MTQQLFTSRLIRVYDDAGNVIEAHLEALRLFF